MPNVHLKSRYWKMVHEAILSQIGIKKDDYFRTLCQYVGAPYSTCYDVKKLEARMNAMERGAGERLGFYMDHPEELEGLTFEEYEELYNERKKLFKKSHEIQDDIKRYEAIDELIVKASNRSDKPFDQDLGPDVKYDCDDDGELTINGMSYEEWDRLTDALIY